MVSVIARRLRKRLSKQQDKNALVLIVGDTGDGKSLDSIGLALAVDPTFHPGRIAHQTAQEFMKVLNLPELKRGHAIIWDDVGRGLKRRDWYEMINKIVIDVLQTFRIMGLLVILNVPDKRLVDNLLLSLFHFWAETIGIDYKNKYGLMKFFQVEINRRSGKTYFKYPRTTQNGKVRVIKSISVKLPPADIIKEYKAYKKRTVDNLIDKSLKEVIKIDTKEEKKLVTNDDVLSIILSKPSLYTKTKPNGKKVIDPHLVSSDHGISWVRANTIKRVAERELGLLA